MADKPIVLTRQNVCAVLERRKFQTRRIINPQPGIGSYKGWAVSKGIWRNTQSFPGQRWKALFQAGDRAYVKEGYRIPNMDIDREQALMVHYLADRSYKSVDITDAEMKLFKARKHPFRATPGRFMYKSLARIFLPIVDVRVERLQDISWEDIIAEGCDVNKPTGDPAIDEFTAGVEAIDTFHWLWDSIHGEGAWERNDWIWVYRWDEIIIEGE